MNQKTIEIEYRALLTEEQFLELRDSLNNKAQLLGNDNKDTLFYIWNDKVIKVVQNAESLATKMVLKPGRIGEQSHFEETELKLDPSMFETAKKFCEQLIPEKVMRSFQFRTNYMYKNVEIALKYTQTWGFHIELEIMVESVDQKDQAEQEIRTVADELKLHLLDDAELSKLTKELESGIVYGKYSDEAFPYK
jgi:adenylate cyclase class IV